MSRGFGRLGRQLGIAFVAVGVAAVAVALVITALSVSGYEGQIRTHHEAQETASIAAGAAAAYSRSDRNAMVASVLAASSRLGAAAQVRDGAGRVLRTSPGFTGPAEGGTYRAPVVAGGRKVGLVVLRFGDRGLEGLLAKFNADRWRARIIGGCAGALLALIVALLLTRRITRPMNQLLRAAQARADGHLDVRVGEVRGFSDIRELAVTFDQMADVVDRQEQLRRNLVADVAHELRTPVAVMQAETEAMLDGVTTMGPADLRSLHEEMLRLGRMIEDLQQLAAAEAAALQLKLVPCDLADIVRMAMRSLRVTLGSAGVSLNLQLEPTPVRCDQNRMQDVVRNLLTNAAKYTPAGGVVMVETAPVRSQGELRVLDTGVGIPAEELPRVTERFFRGRGSHGIGGSGIGLAIVDELVRAQHGTLRIVSKPGDGTQVTVTLPRPGRDEHSADAPAERPAAKSRPESTLAG